MGRRRSEESDRKLLELADVASRTGDAASLTELYTTFSRLADYRDPRWYGARLRGSVGLKKLYERTGEPDHLDKAVGSCRELFGEIPFEHADWATVATIFGRLLQEQVSVTHDLDTLRLCLDTHRLVVDVTQRDDPRAFRRYGDLALAALLLFRRTGDDDALDEAVRVARDALPLADPGDEAEQIDAFRNLTVVLEERWQQRGDRSDLRDSTVASILATEIMPPDDAGWTEQFRTAGGALYAWFTHGGTVEEIEEIFEVYVDLAIVNGEPVEHLERMARATRDPGMDLEGLRTALRALPTEDPRREQYLTRLVGVLGRPPR